MDNIDAIIEAELPETVETPAVEQQAETPENETAEQAEERRFTEAEWLKRERNFEKREGRRAAKLREQNEQLAAELAKFRAQKPQAETPNERPKETDYKTYHEYVEAIQDWKLANAQKALKEELAQKDTHSVANYREQQFIQQSDQALTQATQEYAKIVPNIEQMIQQHGQTISSFPDGVKRVIREADPQDVIKAFHVMVENDTLEDLSDMTPTQAAMAIVKAASMQRPVAVSRAPAPMASARGTSAGVKTLNRMSPQELVDWVNS